MRCAAAVPPLIWCAAALSSVDMQNMMTTVINMRMQWQLLVLYACVLSWVNVITTIILFEFRKRSKWSPALNCQLRHWITEKTAKSRGSSPNNITPFPSAQQRVLSSMALMTDHNDTMRRFTSNYTVSHTFYHTRDKSMASPQPQHSCAIASLPALQEQCHTRVFIIFLVILL